MKKIIGLFILLVVIGATIWRLATHEEPMHAEDYLRLGIERGVAGKHEDAIEAFKKALHENPDYISAYLSLGNAYGNTCLLYTSPSPRDRQKSRMPSSA